MRGVFFRCLRERWCRSLWVCKCSSSCLSWRCAWGETKNRTRTPLCQLPLHCLWDCLCVSPFSPPLLLSALLLFAPYLSVFLLFLVPESGRVCLASPLLAWKSWNRTPLLLSVVHYPTWWESRTPWHSTENVSFRPMSLGSNYLRSTKKFKSNPK